MDNSTSPIDTIGDFFFEVRKGRVGDHSRIHKFGGNDAVGSTVEDIWEAGGIMTWLSSAATMNIVSTNSSDASTGTGAREVKIYGLDDNFLQITTALALSGTTAVTTRQKFRRVYRSIVTKTGRAGTNNDNPSNYGAISISDSASAHVQSYIGAGLGQSNQTHFTIPAGKTGYIRDLTLTMDANKAVNVDMIARERADVIAVPLTASRHIRHWVGVQVPLVDDIGDGTLPEKTDVWFNGSYGGGGTAAIDIEYILIMADNT